jgi:predicted nuclease with TOPRIM domain
VPEVNSKSSEECASSIAVEDIALNLRKVWKVLMELLSHHVPPSCVGEHDDSKSSCYKSVDTPSGPRLVISVSKTFLHLKDLILEKKSLQKELTRLKQLNGHLESKLNNQEHKLSLVSSELRKTWNVVDLMQTQHQQLHTHEKILRYELHEKRKLLNELKQELEYCREKWERARQKNTESEEEWKKLRKEFASRKNQPVDLLNNSGESGFSDERGDDSCEDDDDGICKGTRQLDPGIEDLSNLSDASGIVRTSSPLDSSLPQPHLLLSSSNMCEANMSGSACGQPELLIHEPILSRTDLIPELSPACEHTDILNHSEPELVLDLQTESFPNSECSNSESDVHQETYHIEQQSNSAGMCCESLENDMKQECTSDCRMEPPVNGDCSTISLITMLKQQLSFFSRNLDYITTGIDDISGHHLQALESIFSLPPIQIPKSLNDNITKQDHVQPLYCCRQGDLLHFNSLPQSSSLSATPDLSNDDKFTESVCSGFKFEHEIVSGEMKSLEENSTPTESLLENITSEHKNNSPHHTTDESTLLQEPSDENKSCYQQNSYDESRSSEKLGAVQSIQPLKVNRTAEEIAEARAARLNRLEEQCQQLYNKVTRTTHRSSALCNRLEELHEQYGSVTDSESNIPVPPPMPPVLKAGRIPTSMTLAQRNNLGESVPSATTASSSFLQTPYSRRLPTDTEQNETTYSRENAETNCIPTPPPFPHRPDFSNDDKFTECVCSAVQSEHEIMSGKTKSLEEHSTPTESLLENITLEDKNNSTHCTTDESTLLQGPCDENKSCKQQNSYDESRSSEKLGAVQSIQPLKVNRTAEEIAEARAARLKRLEEQCQQLYNKVTRTNHRSSALCNRLEELHEQYGSVTDSESNIPVPPPMPPVLKAGRIPTSTTLTQRNSLGESMLSTISTSSSFLQTPYSRGLPTDTEQNETNYSRETAETNCIPTPPPFPDSLHPRQMPPVSETIATQISDAEEQSGSIPIPTPHPLPQVLRGRLLSSYAMQSQSSNSESHDGTTHSADESTTQRIPGIMQTQEEMSEEIVRNDGNHSDSNLK